MSLRVLLLGSGGREHVLAWRIAQSPLLAQLFIAPGNPGTAMYGENVPFPVHDHAALVDFARRERIDLVVVGPDNPLADGVVDRFAEAGIVAFGPTAAAARIEGSKAFSKALMIEAGVPTPQAHTFSSADAAADFARRSGQPWVVKADGLAFGKGVVVAETLDETVQAILRLGATSAGQQILLEERLVGREVSLLALCDGKTLLPLPPARDHKRLLDGDLGPNTGGMGAFAPVDEVDEELVDTITRRCMQPVVDSLAARGTPFCGLLYAGAILTEHGPSILEFNARFGDPEAQVVLPLLEGDLLAALLACTQGRLEPTMLTWKPGYAVCVVLSADGYPENPRRGDPISGVESLGAEDDVQIFQAGTVWAQGQLVSAGGRVLGVTAVSRSLAQARSRAYEAAAVITFAGKHYRHDIGA